VQQLGKKRTCASGLGGLALVLAASLGHGGGCGGGDQERNTIGVSSTLQQDLHLHMVSNTAAAIPNNGWRWRFDGAKLPRSSLATHPALPTTQTFPSTPLSFFSILRIF